MFLNKTLGMLCLISTPFIFSNCKKEVINKNVSQSPDSEIPSNTTKSLPIGATIKSIAISYLNQVGTGFDLSATYFAKDFNGDGTADVLMLKTDGNLYLYIGSATPAWPTGSFPDKVGDPLTSVTYTLSSGILVGTGWNFVRYFVADFNGDYKCDIIGQAADGRMWMHHSNGTSFTAGTTQTRFGQAQPWSLTSKFIPVDANGDSKYELLEINDLGPNGYYQQTWSKASGNNVTWESNAFLSNHSVRSLDKNDQFFPINIDGDSDVDLFIIKSNGTIYYSKNNGLSLGFSTPSYAGYGWNNFQNVYGSYHWNCWTPIASLTGRHPNGDFYTYKWNSATNSFSEGVKVGTGWGFNHILTGNFIPDLSSRQDFLGIGSDGKMHAYCTLAILN